MSIKLAAAVVIIIASLSVAGCMSSNSPNQNTDAPFTSPAQTMNPHPDYASVYGKIHVSRGDPSNGGYRENVPFAKSTNARGNDVYSAVADQGRWVVAHELVKTKAEAQQIFNTSVTDKQKNGFTIDPAGIDGIKNPPMSLMEPPPSREEVQEEVHYVDVWAGTLGSQQFSITYEYYPPVNSWQVTTDENIDT